MSTARKSTSYTPSTPRRPCTPESIHGRSPRAPGPPSSPDRRSISADRPTRSYLRPTVSSTLHHGSVNTHQPRRSIDKPPFLPPSSMGVNTKHHKNPSSSSKSSRSLREIFTKATNVMRGGAQRKTSTGAGIDIGKGGGTSTPVRPRSPATLPKKKEASKNFNRSNSVPKKIGAEKKKERDTMSICSIEDNFNEHLPDPVEISSHTPQDVVQSTAPQDVPQVVSYTEKIEDHVHHKIQENFTVATEDNLIEQTQKEVKMEEVSESPTEGREEQPVMEEEVKDTQNETENIVITEKQEEETPEVESVDVVEELPQPPENVPIVEEQGTLKPEEIVTESLEKPEEIVIVSTVEETKEEPKESEEDEITVAENIETTKEEIEKHDVEEEKQTVEPETKVEELSKAGENGTLGETHIEAGNGTIEVVPTVEEKPIASETEEKKEEVVAETPKVEEKPASSIVSEPKKEKATIRKPDAVATIREGAVSNDVIEETKNKLMEKRKNKVLALAGAFETIMQKPEGSTRR